MRQPQTLFLGLLLCLMLHPFLKGQNMVLNPGFESFSVCPAGAGSVSGFCNNWQNLCPTASADYYVGGCPFPPSAAQTPKAGIAYTGIVAFDPVAGTSEFIIGDLCDTLLPGVAYYAEFYVSLDESSQFAIAEMGAYFTNSATAFASCPSAPGIVPQIQNIPILNNASGWTRISGTFVATGGERYIVIGNFNTTVTTTTAPVAGGTVTAAYYFVEDVLVAPLSLNNMLGNDTTICDSLPFWYSVSDPAISSWTWGDGSSNDSLPVNSSGSYNLTVNYSTCVFTDTVSVSFNPIPTLPILHVHDTTGCTGDVISISAYVPGASAYFWSPAGSASGVSCGGVNPTDSIQCFTTSGVYIVEVVYGSCSYFDTLLVNFDTPFPLELGPNLFFCPGESDTLDATIAAPVTYTWSTGDTVPVIIVADSGTYSVAVETSGGCIMRDTVVVTTGNFPAVDLGPDQLLCNGDSVILHAGPGYALYAWSTGLTGASDSLLTVDSIGTYFVMVSDSIGCSTSDTMNVLTGLAPQVDLGPDRSICGSDVVLSTGITDTLVNILWNNGATTPDLTATQTGTYWVTVSNNCGASADTVFLIIIPDPDGYVLPNVFSPNGDGINDLFMAITGIPLTDFELTIFDRWGVRKFFTTDPFFTWNGLTEGGGNPVPEGVYFITFRAHDCAGDRVIRSGNLTVVR